MKRSIKNRTRKQKTLRSLLWIAVLLVVYYASFPFSFTPGQSIRTAERDRGLGPTEIIKTQSIKPVDLYFTASDEALMIVPFRLRPWRNQYNDGTPLKVVDLIQEDGPVFADSIQVKDRKDGRAWFQIFGTVDLEGAVSVRAYTNCPNPDITWQTFPSFDIPIFQAENGNSYFWGGMEAEDPNSVGFPQTLDILDKDGTVLFTYDLYARYMPTVSDHADTP